MRHPAVLARELASIDILSRGRLEVGLGAGYNPLDYHRSGIAMDPRKVRVDRLIEPATVLRALWSDQPASFEGTHYRIDDLDGSPKPLTPVEHLEARRARWGYSYFVVQQSSIDDFLPIVARLAGA